MELRVNPSFSEFRVRGALDEDMKVPKVVLDLVRVVSLFFAYASVRTHSKYGISESDWVEPTRPAVRLKVRTRWFTPNVHVWRVTDKYITMLST